MKRINYRLCKYSFILVIINFALLMTGVAESGILRFIPTVSQLFSLLTVVVLLLSGAIRKDGLSRIIVLWVVYVLLNTLFAPNNSLGRFITILESLYWVSTYFIAQYFLSIRESSEKNDRIVLTVFYIIAALALYSIMFKTSKYNEEGVLIAKNVIFFPLLLAPWIASVRSIKNRWIAMIVLILLTFFSLKRSALIIVLVCFALMLIDKRNRGTKREVLSHIWVFLLLAGVIGYLGFSPSSPISDIQTRFRNINEDEGNGRLDIYAMVTASFEMLPTENKIIGAGYKQVQNTLTGGLLDSSLSAHNDFLEVLYDYGIVGEVIFVALLITILFRSIKFVRSKMWCGIPLMMSFMTILIMCLFSNLIIYPTYILFLSSFWAFAENQHRLQYEHSNH